MPPKSHKQPAPPKGVGKGAPLLPSTPVKGDYLNLPTNANTRKATWVHVPFPDYETSVGKKNSNIIHAEGDMMAIPCITCLTSLASISKDKPKGRGSSLYNEYFACMRHSAYGNGGTQCGRCVGLNKGGSCMQLKPEFYKHIKHMIPLIVDYNTLLDKVQNKNPIDETLLPDELEKIDKLREAAQALDRHVMGAKRSGTEISVTKNKKRKRNDLELLVTDQRIEAQAGMDRLKTMLHRVVTTLDQVTDKLDLLDARVRRLDNLIVVSRARERYLEGVIQAMSNRDLDEDSMAICPPFDIANADFDDDEIDTRKLDAESLEQIDYESRSVLSDSGEEDDGDDLESA